MAPIGAMGGGAKNGIQGAVNRAAVQYSAGARC